MKKKVAMITLSMIISTSYCFAENENNFDQNNQKGKISFTKNSEIENTTNLHFLINQISPYQLFAGTVIPGVLITGMNSDLPGQVIGQVSQNVFDSKIGKYLLIPQGTKIIGRYDSEVTYGQTRGLVIWNRLIFPNGKSVIIENLQGTDQSGYIGFNDKVKSHYSKVLWAAILGGAATAGVASATNANNESFSGNLGAEATNNISSVTNSIVDKNLNVQPTIIIRPGYKFNIMCDKDIILEPYIEE